MISEFLAVLLVGLAAILTAIAGISAVRYRDVRLGFVASALALFAVLGFLAVLYQISPRYGPPFAIAWVPLAIVVAAVALLYASIVGRHSPRAAPAHE